MGGERGGKREREGMRKRAGEGVREREGETIERERE
jgi:hypothetical protein